MATTLLILSVILLSGGAVAAFARGWLGAPLAYAGLTLLNLSGYGNFSKASLVFWAIAVMLVLAAAFKSQLTIPRLCRRYINGGALAGVAVGCITSAATISIGAIIGALLGYLAWWKRPANRAGNTDLQLLVRVGIEAVVVFNMIGLAIMAILK